MALVRGALDEDGPGLTGDIWIDDHEDCRRPPGPRRRSSSPIGIVRIASTRFDEPREEDLGRWWQHRRPVGESLGDGVESHQLAARATPSLLVIGSASLRARTRAPASTRAVRRLS
jgi:hypothetical protein